MDRSITNVIHFMLDECIPPIIRDNKYFMYPFFYIWFHGKNIDTIMNLKSKIHDFTDEDYENFYKHLDSMARDRVTDLSEISIKYILNNLDQEAKTVLDVGCGNGYLIKRIAEKGYECSGCDLKDDFNHTEFNFYKGAIESLPFEDNQFDIVTCCHLIEHLRDLNKAISELKRITKKQLIIVTPCQKYHYYTIDEHINFFP
ncbi:class I SAM-dependent methyltransferase, partial [Bacteroidales bacterium AH-315-N07]|nr:class I SAM-dependent methyltransferase [Bacteroidales bacterium AH-315-N07]